MGARIEKEREGCPLPVHALVAGGAEAEEAAAAAAAAPTSAWSGDGRASWYKAERAEKGELLSRSLSSMPGGSSGGGGVCRKQAGDRGERRRRRKGGGGRGMVSCYQRRRVRPDERSGRTLRPWYRGEDRCRGEQRNLGGAGRERCERPSGRAAESDASKSDWGGAGGTMRRKIIRRIENELGGSARCFIRRDSGHVPGVRGPVTKIKAKQGYNKGCKVAGSDTMSYGAE
jgi:hypothetical protein